MTVRARKTTRLKNKSEILIFLIPLIALFVMACLLFFNISKLSYQFQLMLTYSSHLLFLLTLFLSYWFNHGRIFFTVLYLAGTYLILLDISPPVLEKAVYLNIVYSISGILVPLNILVFSLMEEKGIITLSGRKRILFVLGQLLVTVLIGASGSQGIENILSIKIMPVSLLNHSPITQLSVFLFIITFLLFSVRFYFTRRAMEGFFTGVAAALFLAFYYFHREMAVPVFFTLAGILLVLAIIQDSYSKAYLDDLTGLPGRRALSEELAKLEGTYSIAMLDIDFFKKFNDTYGHNVGDQVLKFISVIIKGVSGGGKAFRYGGEEFTILFPGKKTDEILPHLEYLREKIAGKSFILRSKNRPKEKPDLIEPAQETPVRIQITVSIGAAAKENRLDTPETVLKAADTALYRAKAEGRNRVAIHCPDTIY